MAPRTITLLRQPEGKMGCRLSGDNTISEVHPGGLADTSGLRKGWLVTSINGRPTTNTGAAVSVLETLINQSTFKFELCIDDNPPAKRLIAEAAGGKRKATASDATPGASEALKFPKPRSPSKASKAPSKAPSKQEPSDAVSAAQDEKRQKLLARHRKELASLKEKHAAELSAFENKCKMEQANASGNAGCFVCGTHVPGMVEKTKYSWQSLPAVATSTCCLCELARKCPECKWAVECAYYPDSHHFCDGCEDKANICSECDGGCTKCQEDAGCCSYNGGRGRR